MGARWWCVCLGLMLILALGGLSHDAVLYAATRAISPWDGLGLLVLAFTAGGLAASLGFLGWRIRAGR